MTIAVSRRKAICSLLLAFVSGGAMAFSAGSPICEVNILPLTEMSPTLADPAPFGWELRSSSVVYVAGQPIALRVRHPDPSKRVRGVLLFAKSGPFTGAGRFELPPGYQYIPAPASCGEWAISHTNSAPKEQEDLQFEWQPGSDGTVIVRAFLIEDCAAPNGGCRDQQALTQVLVLQQALFVDGFE